MSALCSRPNIPPPKRIAGRLIAQCKSCSAISPPDDTAAWTATHRSEAVAANCEIGDKAGVVRVA